MRKESLCIAYAGEKVDNGSMDVNDFAPALLAFGDLVSEANKVLNHDDSKVNVYVKSNFQKGSFEINLEIVQTLQAQLSMIFGASQSYNVKEILDTLGVLVTVSGCSLIELIRWVKKRKITKVTKVDKDTVAIYIDNEYKEVSIGTLSLFRSIKIRKYVESTLAPLKQPGIDVFEVRDKAEGKVYQRVGKDEVDSFNAPTPTDAPATTTASKRHVLVHILNVNFENDLKWRFDDGAMKFYADIKDKEFLRDVQSGRVSFTSGDVLQVELVAEQMLTGDTIKTEYKITKVLRFIRRAEQLDLPFDE